MTTSTHTLWRSADRLCPFTLDFVSALLHKNGFYLHEERGLTTRTFSLRAVVPLHEDEQRAVEDEQGQSYEPGCHVLAPTQSLIHDAASVDAQREAAGLSYDEGTES